jgi:hypothetical protein
MHAARPTPGGRLRAPLLASMLLATAFGVLAQPAAEVEEGRPLLNSERIARRFGSYGIEVLASDSALRVSNLYSVEAEGRICRTFAVVRYPSEIDPAFAEEHDLVLEGGSIGAVFAERGWNVERRHLWLGEIPASGRVSALMGNIPPASLAVHVFELVVARGATSFAYAIIAEVHHPDYLKLEDLRRIFGTATAGEAAGRMLLATLEAMHAP